MAMDLVSDLSRAIDHGEIVAHYQPQVDIRTLRIVAVEALARWTHPLFGVVGPGIFVPLAEANGLIHEIGALIIDDGTLKASEWTAAGLDIDVAINVSAAQLANVALLDRLENRLKERSLVPERIVLEITESLPLPATHSVTERLRALRSRGMGISIDDFGTGYSALTHHGGLPATEPKIDKSLIQDPDASGTVVFEVLREAHAQGLRVVAEGIETTGHLETAQALNCDRAQGYLFGRPLPADLLTPALVESADRGF